jgi:hypothetical protein
MAGMVHQELQARKVIVDGMVSLVYPARRESLQIGH